MECVSLLLWSLWSNIGKKLHIYLCLRFMLEYIY